MRESMIALIKQAEDKYLDLGTDEPVTDIETFVVDYLIAKGIIVLPCKVGDTVYDRFGNPITIRGVGIDYVFKGTHDISDISAGYPFSVRKSISLPVEFRYIDFGEIVFLTKEEAAEKALKEREPK